MPGLVVFAAFIGLSLAGQARLDARQPSSFNAPPKQEPDLAAHELLDPEAAPALEVVDEAGELPEWEATPSPPAPPVEEAVVQQAPVQPEVGPEATAHAPVEPAPAEASTDQAAGILLGLEAALVALDSAGREPGRVMVAVQEARSRLQGVEAELKAMRGASLPGLTEARRAHGRLTRACFELDTAARQALGVAPAGMGDPFAQAKRLVGESRDRVAAARRAMQPER